MNIKRALDGHLVGVIVFCLSVLSLGALEFIRSPEVTVAAVARGHAVEHPAPADATVARVHVRLGELVQAGSPLVTLEDASLRGELERLDLNIFITLDEVHLAMLADTAARAEGDEADEVGEPAEPSEPSGRGQTAEARMVTELARVRALRETEFAEPTAITTTRLYERRLQLLQSQREALVARIGALEISATELGVVATVLQMGASVSRGSSVARLVPERATEVVAYLPAETNPADVPISGRVLIAQTSGNACAGEFPQRLGAEVGRSPGSSNGIFGQVTRGLPLHITLPPECELGVGQRVWVSLEAH